MLATPGRQALRPPGWLWEPKLDGIRVLAYLRDGKVELRSRRGVDVTKQYPTLVAALEGAAGADSMVLDGEICALDEDGVPRFQLLQPRINLTRGVDPSRSMQSSPSSSSSSTCSTSTATTCAPSRCASARRCSTRTSLASDRLRLLSSHRGATAATWPRARSALGFEGVVGKRADSRYESGERGRSLAQVQDVQEQEFVVGGFTPGEGGAAGHLRCARARLLRRRGQAALRRQRRLRLRRRGARGDAQSAASLSRRTKSPFADDVEGVTLHAGRASWSQVKFAEWTKDGRLRAPVFLGLRDDIEPRNVHRETPLQDGLSEAVEQRCQAAEHVAQQRREGIARRLERTKPRSRCESTSPAGPAREPEAELHARCRRRAASS